MIIILSLQHCNIIFVLSLDKPSPPQGPLDVFDITLETCSMAWRPPLDDGGSPITNYVIEKMDPSSGVSIMLLRIWTHHRM